MSFLDSGAVDAFDTWADRKLDSVRALPGADRLFYSLSEAANHSKLWHVLTWIPVCTGQRRWQCAAAVSAALGVESAVVNGVIKQLFKRERPVVDHRPRKLRTPKTSSFPSGHATSAVVASMLLSSRRSAGLFAVLAALVASSRAYVRIHHASDVIGGIGVGLGLGAIAKRALRSIAAR